MQKLEKTFTLDSISDAALTVFETYKNNKVWAFNAPMGAGKTTFINALCKNILEIEEISSSPTFSIINEYYSPVAGQIFHLDLYRLRDEEEAIQAGVEDTLYSGKMCLVEWPEKAAGLLPDDTVYLKLEVIDENTRKIIVEDALRAV